MTDHLIKAYEEELPQLKNMLVTTGALMAEQLAGAGLSSPPRLRTTG